MSKGGKKKMNKTTKISLFIIASLSIFNGLMNIIDDGRILSYDIASILSGIGFMILSFTKKS